MIVLDLFQFQFDDSSITARTCVVFDNDIVWLYNLILIQFDDSSITVRTQLYLIMIFDNDIFDDGIFGPILNNVDIW